MKSRFLGTVFAAGLAALTGLGFNAAPASAQKVLKMQASWPASLTIMTTSQCGRSGEELTGGSQDRDHEAGRSCRLEVLEHPEEGDEARTLGGYGKQEQRGDHSRWTGWPWGMDHQDSSDGCGGGAARNSGEFSRHPQVEWCRSRSCRPARRRSDGQRRSRVPTSRSEVPQTGVAAGVQRKWACAP